MTHPRGRFVVKIVTNDDGSTVNETRPRGGFNLLAPVYLEWLFSVHGLLHRPYHFRLIKPILTSSRLPRDTTEGVQ